MKRIKIIAICLMLTMTFSFSAVSINKADKQDIGVGVTYLASKKGASDEGVAILGAAFTVESAVQGLLWGSVFGGPVGAAVGLGIGL